MKDFYNVCIGKIKGHPLYLIFESYWPCLYLLLSFNNPPRSLEQKCQGVTKND